MSRSELLVLTQTKTVTLDHYPESSKCSPLKTTQNSKLSKLLEKLNQEAPHPRNTSSVTLGGILATKTRVIFLVGGFISSCTSTPKVHWMTKLTASCKQNHLHCNLLENTDVRALKKHESAGILPGIFHWEGCPWQLHQRRRNKHTLGVAIFTSSIRPLRECCVATAFWNKNKFLKHFNRDNPKS